MRAATDAGNRAARSTDRTPTPVRVAALVVIVLYVAGIVANAWLGRLIGPRSGEPVEEAIIAVGFGMFAVVAPSSSPSVPETLSAGS
ncbi:MAG: hypothetical protein AVDCRST_MAG22-313 [uncultured Rubrobacteraceae bacterium]|uniref:Uncharacterized protein n=1 Tax=uncultured Rubrobacteraceae bacterium TaxID=349277 RepID=A0A6J4NJF6_9ACTN|nr:MAG: hypothetical protein AVDCRST_MAG22-313 [uncultured Rubrobacteraceae bacterium]